MLDFDCIPMAPAKGVRAMHLQASRPVHVRRIGHAAGAAARSSICSICLSWYAPKLMTYLYMLEVCKSCMQRTGVRYVSDMTMITEAMNAA